MKTKNSATLDPGRQGEFRFKGWPAADMYTVLLDKLIVDIIPYRMSTFVLISIFRFLKPFPLTSVSILVLQ